MIKVCPNGIFELYCQGRYYGVARVEPLPQKGAGNFHINIVRFSHTIFNRMKRDEETLMGYISQMGYTELISAVGTENVNHGDLSLWSKFVMMFGFEEPKLFTTRLL